MKLCVALLLLASAACATTWNLGNHTQDQFNSDNYQCNMEAQRQAAIDRLTMAPLAAALTEKNNYKGCMIGRGYVKS